MTSRLPLAVLVIVAIVSWSIALVCSASEARKSQSGWNGIVPLHSTRSNIENRLGTPSAECRCTYSTPDEVIRVNYAVDYCKGPPYGWNVPADTILAIEVLPKRQPGISESDLLAQGYIKSREIDSAIVYYTSVRRGIKYAFSDGKVNSVSYIPSSNDVSLRCPGFPPYDGGSREYHPYSSFSHKAELIDERLSEFALRLADNSNVVGYVITYAGPVSRTGEAKTMGNYARRVITAKNRVPRARIVVIDGGFRQDAEYELFLVPKEMPGPVPTPTLATNQVKIVSRSSKP